MQSVEQLISGPNGIVAKFAFFEIFVGYGYETAMLLSAEKKVRLVMSLRSMPSACMVLRILNTNIGIKMGFWYSLDMLLNIIHRRERHYDRSVRQNEGKA